MFRKFRTYDLLFINRTIVHFLVFNKMKGTLVVVHNYCLIYLYIKLIYCHFIKIGREFKEIYIETERDRQKQEQKNKEFYFRI